MPNVSEVVDRKHHKHAHHKAAVLISLWGRHISRHRFLLLFLFLILTLALYPFAESNASSYTAFRLVGTAVILLSVYAVGFRRSLLIMALVLAVPRLFQHFVYTHTDASLVSILSICLSFVFDVFVIVVMLRRVYLCDEPNAETIFGALSIYLLIGYTFASVYGMLATLQPRAFYLDPLTNTHSIPNRFDFIFYSFGTQTALGASGIDPATSQARALTVIQSMLGIFYLAVLIARLMSAYRMRALARQTQ